MRSGFSTNAITSSGETALIAGGACRYLSRREEAWIWFERAEAGFRHTMNAPGELSRLAYQRLAERFEERQLDLVLELLPSLVESFKKLGMIEDALKCRFLEGARAHGEGRARAGDRGLQPDLYRRRRGRV